MFPESLQKYLIPLAQDQCGVNDETAFIEEDALKALIKNYCRESGVRSLLKHIEKVRRAFGLDTVWLEHAKCALRCSSAWRRKCVFVISELILLTRDERNVYDSGHVTRSVARRVT